MTTDGDEVLRVFVVEDDLVFADSLREVIDGEPDMTCIGVTHDLASTPDRMRELEPDVAVIDLHLPDGDGLTLCRTVKDLLPELRVVVLTADDDPNAVVKSMEHHADGFALKLASFEAVLNTIRFVQKGSSIYGADHLGPNAS